MRLGFVLGFLIGGAAATLLGKAREEELAAAVAGAAETIEETANPIADRIKHQVEVARDAAREAQLAKEAELLHEYDELIHRKDKPAQ